MRPLAANIRTTQRIATGEYDLVITSSHRRDEVGAVGKVIKVFRDQAVENHRLTAAHTTTTPQHADTLVLLTSLHGEPSYDQAKRTLAAMSAQYGTARRKVVEGTAADVLWKDGATFVEFKYNTATDVLEIEFVSATSVQTEAAHDLLNGR